MPQNNCPAMRSLIEVFANLVKQEAAVQIE